MSAQVARMAPAHLLLLNRIATADDLAPVDQHQTQMCQVQAWAAQEIRSGRLWSLVEQQHFMQHVAAAASNAFRQLGLLSKGTFDCYRWLPMCILETLDLLVQVLSAGVTGPYGRLTSSQKESYLSSVRTQVLQTDILSSISSASTGVAAAITRHLQSSRAPVSKHSSASVLGNSHSSQSSNDSSKSGGSRTSRKRLGGKLRRSQPGSASSATRSRMPADICVTEQLGTRLLLIWHKLHTCWVSSRESSEQSSQEYHTSAITLSETLVPISQLAMAMLRFYSVYSSNNDCIEGHPAIYAREVTISMSQLLDWLLQESGIGPFQDVLMSPNFQEAVIFSLASSTYVSLKRQPDRIKVSRHSSSASEPAATVSSSRVAPAPDAHPLQGHMQQFQSDAGDQHEQLLELLGLVGFICQDGSIPVLEAHYQLFHGTATQAIALTAVNHLRLALALGSDLPTPWQTSGMSHDSSNQQVFLPCVLLQLLLRVLKQTEGSLTVALCLIFIASAARQECYTADALPAGDAAVAATTRSILAPLILQGVQLIQDAIDRYSLPEDKHHHQTQWARLLSQLLTTDHLSSDAQQQLWASIVNIDPMVAVTSLECTIRVIGGSSMQHSAAGRSLRHIVDAIAAHDQLLQAARKGIKRSGAAAKLTGMMMSCLKHCWLAADMKALELAAAVASAAIPIAAEAGNGSSNRSHRQKGRHAVASSCQWGHIAARALLTCARILLWSPAAEAAADDEESWLRDQVAAMSAATTGFSAIAWYLQAVDECSVLVTQQDDTSGTGTEEAWRRGMQAATSCLGTSSKDWQCRDVTDVLLHLSRAAGWCGEQLQQQHELALTTDANSKTCNSQTGCSAGKTSNSKLQQRVNEIQEGLNDAAQQWQEMYSQQMMQESSEAGLQGTAWMMLLGARQVIGYKLAYQLQQCAVELCAVLPTTLCCNNPSCDNLSGVSELSCVGRRKCSRCQAAGYCSKECQTQHWSKHKVVCRELCKSSS